MGGGWQSEGGGGETSVAGVVEAWVGWLRGQSCFDGRGERSRVCKCRVKKWRLGVC